MAEVFIHDLPEIDETRLKGTDIMVIETEDDTYHIQISSLKSIFSCDEKLDAIYNNILDKFQQIQEDQGSFNANILNKINDHTTQINSMVESINTLTEKVVINEYNISVLTQNIKDLKTRIDVLENRINSIDISIDSINDRITPIEVDFDDIKNRLSSIEDINKNQSVSINDNSNKIEELRSLIESYNGLSEDTLRETEKEIKELIIDKYEELLHIIDECHHQIPILV